MTDLKHLGHPTHSPNIRLRVVRNPHADRGDGNGRGSYRYSPVTRLCNGSPPAQLGESPNVLQTAPIMLPDRDYHEARILVLGLRIAKLKHRLGGRARTISDIISLMWGRVVSTGGALAGLQAEAPSHLVKRWQTSNWQQPASLSRLTRRLRPPSPLLEGGGRAP